ncbi:Ig-like domain-containing protein [Pseudomonas stutzeri]|nr:Ig-like domain-containing protein [Stutzerimonas stutzeri]
MAPVNDAPVAQNDAVTVSEDVPFSSSISLLANDSDVDGDSLSVVAGTFVTALTVTPVNDAPVAQNDAVTVSEDVPFSSSISLLANDSDVDGDSLSVVAGTFVTVTKVPATTDRVSPSTSLSLASRLMLELNGTSSLTVTASFWATGASFTGATLTVRSTWLR